MSRKSIEKRIALLTSMPFWRINGYLRRNRRFRKPVAKSESRLWEMLRKGVLGYAFKREYRFPHFVADFYCPDARLAVEIERNGHTVRQKEEEQRRRLMIASGIKVLAFPEEMILQRPLAVRSTIREELPGR